MLEQALASCCGHGILQKEHMVLALKKQLSLWREIREIRRAEGNVPNTVSVEAAWRAIRKGDDGRRPFALDVGGFSLTAPNHYEFAELYEEIFCHHAYGIHLPEKEPVIIDCGANVGFAAVYFKLLHPGARLLCYEPNPRIFPMLEANLKAAGASDAVCVQAACGEAAGEVELHLEWLSHGVNVGNVFGNETEVISVPQEAVSSRIEGPVDLLKIDVEGAEHAVMRDLVSSGKIQQVRRMALEYHHLLAGQPPQMGALLHTLEQQGFSYHLTAKVPPQRRFNSERWDTVMIYAFRPDAELK